MITKAITVAFSGTLAYEVDSLLPIFQEHLEDQEGEILPHIFMADVERWVEREVERSRSDVTRVLEMLEDACTRQVSDLRELVVASFLEHLPQSGPLFSQIHALMGPCLACELDKLALAAARS